MLTLSTGLFLNVYTYLTIKRAVILHTAEFHKPLRSRHTIKKASLKWIYFSLENHFYIVYCRKIRFNRAVQRGLTALTTSKLEEIENPGILHHNLRIWQTLLIQSDLQYKDNNNA